MSDELAVRYTAIDGTEIEMDAESVQRFVITSGVKVTEPELARFLAVCSARGMNPLAGDCHLVKYSAGSPASVIPSKDFYNRVCKSQPSYDGEEAGIIVVRDGRREYREGTDYAQGEQIVGGWARVHDKRWSHPTFVSVPMAEAAQQNGTWKRMPAWMIRKVALSRAQREAYPDLFGGTYDESEMPAVERREVPAEVVEDVPQEAAPVTQEVDVEAINGALEAQAKIDVRADVMRRMAARMASVTGEDIAAVKRELFERGDFRTMSDDEWGRYVEVVEEMIQDYASHTEG